MGFYVKSSKIMYKTSIVGKKCTKILTSVGFAFVTFCAVFSLRNASNGGSLFIFDLKFKISKIKWQVKKKIY